MVKKAALTGGNCRSALGWFAEGWGRGYDAVHDWEMIKNACFPCDLCAVFCYCVHRAWLTRRKRVFGVRVHVCFVVLCMCWDWFCRSLT